MTLINKKKKVDLSVMHGDNMSTETKEYKKKIYRRYYKYLLPGRYIIKEILWYGSKRTTACTVSKVAKKSEWHI